MKNSKLEEDDFLGYFSIERKTEKGVMEVALIEKGETIEISEQNKLEYIDLCIQYISYKSVKEFIESIKAGLYSVRANPFFDIVVASR
jgi:hypothetical protein